jgi:hypothetical protein
MYHFHWRLDAVGTIFKRISYVLVYIRFFSQLYVSNFASYGFKRDYLEVRRIIYVCYGTLAIGFCFFSWIII